MRSAGAAAVGAALLTLAPLGGGAGAAAPLRWARSADFPFQEDLTILGADLNAAGDAVVALRLGGQLAVVERRGRQGPWSAATPLVTEAGDRSVLGRPIVRLNARGAALAVWATSAGTLVAARREWGGPWSRGQPVGVPDAGLRGVSEGATVQVALGDDGRGRVVTSSCRRPTSPDEPPACAVQMVVQARSGRPWTRVGQDLHLPRFAHVAINRRGGAVAAWAPDDQPGPGVVTSRIEAATLGPAGWAPAEPVATLPEGREPYALTVGFGDGGDAAIAWTLRAPSVPRLAGLHASVRPPGGPWTEPAELAPDSVAAVDPASALDARGNLLVTWNQPSPANRGTIVAALRPRAAAGFGPPTVIDATGADEAVRPAMPHLLSDRAAVLIQVDTHGAHTTSSIQVGAIAADPRWRSIGLPAWDGGTQAVAFAPTGAALAAGRPYQPPLRGAFRSVLRVESYDSLADPPRPRVVAVGLVRSARGRALAITLSRRARVEATLVHPTGPIPQRIELGPVILGPGRHLLPVRGLRKRAYNALIQLCTSASGCEALPAVTVRAS